MRTKLLMLALLAMSVLTSCNNTQKIENWEPVLFESVGAPFLKPPTQFIEFQGPYADGENNDGIFFTFETKNHKQSRKYLEKSIKDLVKYADNVYDLSEYTRSDSELTLEKLQEYAIDKDAIQLKGSQWGGAYHCRIGYSKDGKYFKFSGGYQVYNNHARANCTIGIYPLSHL